MYMTYGGPCQLDAEILQKISKHAEVAEQRRVSELIARTRLRISRV